MLELQMCYGTIGIKVNVPVMLPVNATNFDVIRHQ